MRYGWMFIPVILITGAIAFLAWYRYRINSIKRSKKHAAIIAHTSSIKQRPAYKKALKQYYILLGTAAFFLASTLFSFAALAARPIEIRADRNINKTRDVVLCLDVSGSMRNYSHELLSHLSSITEKLAGERVGVTIFDSFSINIAPLSDDYQAVREVLSDLDDSFAYYSSMSNRMADDSSNIGEGVMGCINSFDTLGDERTQSIILMTDNIQPNKTKITLPQAVAYGKKYGISFYGIGYPTPIRTSEKEQLQLALDEYEEIDGSNDRLNVSNILDRIFEKEAVKIETARELVAVDTPEVFITIGIVSFAALLFTLWRLHL